MKLYIGIPKLKPLEYVDITEFGLKQDEADLNIKKGIPFKNDIADSFMFFYNEKILFNNLEFFLDEIRRIVIDKGCIFILCSKENLRAIKFIDYYIEVNNLEITHKEFLYSTVKYYISNNKLLARCVEKQMDKKNCENNISGEECENIKNNYKIKITDNEKMVIELFNTKRELNDIKRYYEIESDFMKNIFIDYNNIKTNKLLMISDYLKYKKRDMTCNLNEEGKKLVDVYMEKNAHALKGYILSRTPFFIHKQILEYLIYPKKDNWDGIQIIATNFNMIKNDIVIIFELVDSSNEIIRYIPVHSSRILHDKISFINFDKIEDSKDKQYLLRVASTQHSDIHGISVYEWVKLNILGQVTHRKLLGTLSYS